MYTILPISATGYHTTYSLSKGSPPLFTSHHKRLDILFPEQRFEFFSQTFSIHCHSSVLGNHPERMVSRVDPLSPHRMRKLVGDFQAGFQLSDLLLKGIFSVLSD